MTEPGRGEALEAIAAEIRSCTRCRLHQGRTRAVPGEGDPATEVVLVGEGPGFNEDRQGRPFVGQAGAFLGELLGSVGWRREDVFVTNVVKCRPPDNRDPEPDEIAACEPYLRRQLETLDPALVVTLGRHSMGRFLPGARIGAVHGTTRPADPATGAANALVFAMYHPAAALHQGSLRQTLLDDMQSVPAALLASRRRRGEAPEPAPEPTPSPTSADLPSLDLPAPDRPASGPVGPDHGALPAGVAGPAPSTAEPDADQLTLF